MVKCEVCGQPSATRRCLICRVNVGEASECQACEGRGALAPH